MKAAVAAAVKVKKKKSIKSYLILKRNDIILLLA